MRLFLALGVLLSCVVRHVDEAQVRTILAQRLQCDEQLLELETEASPGEGVALYKVHGCNQVQSFYCRQPGQLVECENANHGFASSSPTSDVDEASGRNYDSGGCNCGHLGGDHSSSPAASPATTSVMPSSPSLNNQRR
ncbi:MAG: hypothetical protein ABI461_18970 [Polyangiaceae bacterium]